MGFWVVAAVMAVGIALALALPMLRGRNAGLPGSAGLEDGSAASLAVYRDQLREVDRDAARGLLAPDEAERVRVEVARRLLDADRAAEATGAGAAPRGSMLAGLAAMGVAAGAVGLYLWLGVPGYGDLPLEARIAAIEAARADRPRQAEAEASMPAPALPEADPEFLKLIAKLRAAVEERPDDLQGQTLLARNEAALGNFGAARAAQEQVLALKGNGATATDWADYAELAVLAAGGYVSPEAEAAIREALRRDPTLGPARYYAGLLHAQTSRPDLAFRYWAPLLDESAPGAPWVPVLRAELPAVAARAGVRYSLPETGPSSGAMAAMAPEEREAAIRSMVDGLAERLGSSGGTAAEWARLIVALGVLGERERAAAIAAEARTAFAGAATALAEIEAAAVRAGLGP